MYTFFYKNNFIRTSSLKKKHYEQIKNKCFSNKEIEHSAGKQYEYKNILRTIQPRQGGKFKNTEPRRNFTGSYIKKCSKKVVKNKN